MVSVSRTTVAGETQKDRTKHRISYVRDNKDKQEILLDCFCTHEGKCVIIFVSDPKRCAELEGILFDKGFTSTCIESVTVLL
jgi:superfamily II DNA/RNA helicase